MLIATPLIALEHVDGDHRRGARRVTPGTTIERSFTPSKKVTTTCLRSGSMIVDAAANRHTETMSGSKSAWAAAAKGFCGTMARSV